MTAPNPVSHAELPGTGSLVAATRRILEMIAAGASLTDILTNVCTAIDAQYPDMMSMVLLTDPDGQRMWPVAAPRVPADFVKQISPVILGPSSSTCGTDEFQKERVISADIANDPQWVGRPSREAALANGLRAAWSQPLLSRDNEILGTFAMFLTTPRSPSPSELCLIEDAAQIAIIAIEGERAQAALKKTLHEIKTSEQELRGIVDAVSQAIVVLGPDGKGLYANRQLLEYTGFTMEHLLTPDAQGNPSLFHPEDWARLQEERLQGLARKEPFELEWRLKRKDGVYRWFLVRYHPLKDEHGQILRWYASGTDIDDRKRAEERMQNENLALREEIDRASMFEEIVGSSVALQRVLAQVARVAKTDTTVLILGETGTGKELVARAIHRRSSRSARAFIRVNCAAIPQALIASELFGHEKGAFTGALSRRLGRFEAADGGTILLDEVAELPSETQVSLLRVLQEREIERVGSSHPISVDVRVLASTNRDLEAAVESGAFRQDLYYRLNVFPIKIPPLRERVEDIPVLVEYLVERYARSAGKSIRHISKRTLERLQAYEWPGNVRELQNVIERAVVLCDGDTFSVDESWLKAAPSQPSRQPSHQTTLAQGEKALIEAALAESNGRISGPNGAAARLGIPRQTLESKIKALRIDKLSHQKR